MHFLAKIVFCTIFKCGLYHCFEHKTLYLIGIFIFHNSFKMVAILLVLILIISAMNTLIFSNGIVYCCTFCIAIRALNSHFWVSFLQWKKYSFFILVLLFWSKIDFNNKIKFSRCILLSFSYGCLNKIHYLHTLNAKYSKWHNSV